MYRAAKNFTTFIQVSRNVRLPHGRIATFSTHRDFFDYCTLIFLLTD